MVTVRDERTHPLLAQVPLTVSPFVNLPTAATLPYTYKSMPSTLPPPTTGITGADGASKPQYVVSNSGGHAAHPDEIVASCRALQAHITRSVARAEQALRDLEAGIADRDLAEKRRVAPGWLDSDARLLQPERHQQQQQQQQQPQEEETSSSMDEAAGRNVADHFSHMSIEEREGATEMAGDNQGEELDRVFGGMK
ncbi:hypothetical protein F4780DRAFT_59140 [Xylariomycetidae sp. FL0641]|nr:hypothetical protein F4780DRAFT_59140 [Xylariomycetidae sp. FL0641]